MGFEGSTKWGANYKLVSERKLCLGWGSESTCCALGNIPQIIIE